MSHASRVSESEIPTPFINLLGLLLRLTFDLPRLCTLFAMSIILKNLSSALLGHSVAPLSMGDPLFQSLSLLSVVYQYVLGIMGILFGIVFLSPYWIPFLFRVLLPGYKSTVTYKNGLKVYIANKLETDVLFDEIWGKKDSYMKDGRIQFFPGMTIVDCGANIGMFSLFAAKQCNGSASIISIEPIESTFEILRLNAAAANNGEMQEVLGSRLPNITPVNYAVGNIPSGETRNLVFEHHPNLTIWSTSDQSLASERIDRFVTGFSVAYAKGWMSYVIPTFLFRLALRSLLVRYLAKTEHVNAKLIRTGDLLKGVKTPTIDLLKIDCEGAEIDILKGIDDNQWSRIKQVVMEVEDFSKLRAAERIFRERGFSYIDWEATELKAGLAFSEVSMIYASRETFETVEARISSFSKVSSTVSQTPPKRTIFDESVISPESSATSSVNVRRATPAHIPQQQQVPLAAQRSVSPAPPPALLVAPASVSKRRGSFGNTASSVSAVAPVEKQYSQTELAKQRAIEANALRQKEAAEAYMIRGRK